MRAIILAAGRGIRLQQPQEQQHALMGPITPKMLETMEIPWELFPSEIDGIGPALDRAVACMDETGRPYALVMQKGTVALTHSSSAPTVPENGPTRDWARQPRRLEHGQC
jgi:phosphonopyruvate decarboxylase